MNNNKNFCPFIKGNCNKDCTFYRELLPGENHHSRCNIHNFITNNNTNYRLNKIENAIKTLKSPTKC